MRRIVLLAAAVTAVPGIAQAAIAASSGNSPAMKVSVGPHEPYPYPTTVKPQVDQRYLPVGCDGRLVTDLFNDTPRRGRVRMGCGPKWGRLAPEAILSVMNAAPFSACPSDSDEALISVRFVIGRDGSTGHVTAKAADPLLGDCIERTVERLTFPTPKDGPVMVTFPLRRSAPTR